MRDERDRHAGVGDSCNSARGVHIFRKCLREANAISRLSLVATGCDDGDSTTAPTAAPGTSFFVSSATSVTGNLGGLAGADATCQRLAFAVGEGSRTWRAY
jgi:hypothetical protein